MTRKFAVAVIGPGEASEPVMLLARKLGRYIAAQRWVLITGGRNAGVMKAVNKGAKAAKDSLTIGILPDRDTEVSPDVDVTIVTDVGEARNNIIVLSADVVVACGVSDAGTTSEVALAIKNGKPLVILEAGLEARRFFRGMTPEQLNFADSLDEAIRLINELFSRME